MEKTKKIRISVYWADDLKSISITEKEYQFILDGNPFETCGEGYCYEGEDFTDFWTFEGGTNSNLVVSYGEDGGRGFDGSLLDCKIEEIEE
jgi:hypothetical protein